MTNLHNNTETRVTYAETDAMGIVYYANYLRWFEMGRTEFIRNLGIPYKELEENGIYLPVSEVFCKYLISAKYDDVLIIETSVEFLRRASIQFAYRILRKEDRMELVTGKTLHAFVDREGKIVRIPAILKEKLKS
ncbi:MAG: acyl-CoA thioesterase [Deltaproteobacteria bacterium]|nr:acyl-CoA thioesterase [Deltaproteobacteria bacterium]